MKKSIKLILGTFLLSAFGLVACNNALPNPNEQGGSSNERLVEKVALSEEYRELKVEETLQLSATITYKDGQEVDVTKRWMSSNSRIASVTVDPNDAKKVTVEALAPGIAYISYLAGLKKASCEIKVLSDEVVPGPDDPTPPGPQPGQFTISLDYSEETLLPLETLTITATTSEEATIAWSIDDSTVATLSATSGESVTVEAQAEGVATVTATAKGVSARCVINVTDEDYAKNINVYFFIDYNNVDANDPTATKDPTTGEVTVPGTKLLAQFKWYGDKPLSESGKVPANPTTAMDPAFPYFIGWSSHTIIDTKNDLWTMDQDLIGSSLSFIYFYGIWSDVAQGGFTA